MSLFTAILDFRAYLYWQYSFKAVIMLELNSHELKWTQESQIGWVECGKL